MSKQGRVTVLYVDEAIAFGGSLMVMGNLIGALDKAVFRPVFVGEMEVAALKDYLRCDSGVYSIRRLYNYAQWSRTLKFIDKLPGRFIRKITNYTLSAIRSLLNSVYLFRLIGVILKENVDIIHVSNGMNNFAPVFAAVLLRRHFVVHFHGIESPGVVHKAFLDRVPVFIAPSSYMKACLVDNGIPEERLQVISNPVRLETVSPGDVEVLRQRYGINESDLIMGIVGRIVSWKGHLEFLQAAAPAMKLFPELKLLIVGDYSDGNKAYQDEITRVVETGRFSNRVIFTGYVKDVGNHYCLMDVCVHASIQPEPFGLVITEAMSHGIPVIASNRGAPGEIISEGETGYLVDPEAEDEFADRMISLLSDRAVRERIGEAARQYALETYPLDAYARKMEGVYREVLGY